MACRPNPRPCSNSNHSSSIMPMRQRHSAARRVQGPLGVKRGGRSAMVSHRGASCMGDDAVCLGQRRLTTWHPDLRCPAPSVPRSSGRRGQAIPVLRGRVVPDHLAQKTAQLTLLVRGETLKAPGRSPHAGQHPFAQPPSGGRQDDVLHPPVLGARLAGDESPRLEPVDESGDVRVIAREKRGELGHRQRRIQLKKRSRLRRVKVKRGGGDEKSASVLSIQNAKQSPDLSRRLHRAGVHGRLHSCHSIEILDC